MEAIHSPIRAEELQRLCVGQVLSAPEELEARAGNFGGMCRVLPALVLRPSCVEDVQAALRFAAEMGLTVSTRGASHSQAQQGLGAGLLVEMTSLKKVLHFDSSKSCVEVEAGISWSAVVDSTVEQKRLPVALTHALETTVGGTLSVGGVGSAAWSFGPQVDNILYLDVVTAGGDLVRCSMNEERGLFDAVRAGLGQCGVIVRAGLPLRTCSAFIETRSFVYREVEALLRDAEELIPQLDPLRWLAVRLGWDPLRRGTLMAALFVGRAASDAPVAWEDLPLRHHSFEAPRRRDVTWPAGGNPGHPFFRVQGALPPARPVTPPAKNPWVDFLFPMRGRASQLAALVASTSDLIKLGSAQIAFVRRGANPAPLLVTPAPELSLGLGMFPTFAAEDAEKASHVMQNYARDMRAAGGARYLSGYFEGLTAADLGEHYGPAWPHFCAAKQLYDPDHRFESRFLSWPLVGD